MSTIKSNAIQVGQSITASDNFTIYQPITPNGTLKIGNGNAGSATDTISIDSSGNLSAYGITANNGITATAGTGLIQAGTIQSFGDLSSTSQNGGQLAGLRNKIINGNMDVVQRGVANNVTISGNYGPCDRWKSDALGNTFTATIQSFATTDSLYTSGATRYMQIAVTGSSSSASNYYKIGQGIENVRLLAGKTVTVSFWAKALATTSIGVELWQMFGTDGDPFQTGTGQVQEITTTWAKYTKTFTLPSLGNKALGPNNTSFTQLEFWLVSGNNTTSTAATRSGNIGNTTKTVSIAQVQLEVGTVATEFELRPIGMELALCQRYYQRNPSATAAFGTTPSAVLDGRSYNPGSSSASVTINRYLPVVMRITPTVNFYYDIQDGATVGPSTPVSINPGMFFFNAAVPTGNWIDLDDWQAVAEL